MTQIKTRNWWNNISILFKPCALDIYTHNGGVERFGCLIIEKILAMR